MEILRTGLSASDVARFTVCQQPDEQRPAVRERVFSDVSCVEALVRKRGLV